MQLPLELIIPAVLGLVVPFITRFFKDEQIQTGLNIILSAAIAASTAIPSGLDWKGYLAAFFIAWLTTLRSDATQLPEKIYSKRVTPGRHEKVDKPEEPS